MGFWAGKMTRNSWPSTLALGVHHRWQTLTIIIQCFALPSAQRSFKIVFVCIVPWPPTYQTLTRHNIQQGLKSPALRDVAHHAKQRSTHISHVIPKMPWVLGLRDSKFPMCSDLVLMHDNLWWTYKTKHSSHAFRVQTAVQSTVGQHEAYCYEFSCNGFETSVRRSSSLDWKKDRNWTEPNCKRPDHQLRLHKFWKFSVASCDVCQKIEKLKKTGLDRLQLVFRPVMYWTSLMHIFP